MSDILFAWDGELLKWSSVKRVSFEDNAITFFTDIPDSSELTITFGGCGIIWDDVQAYFHDLIFKEKFEENPIYIENYIMRRFVEEHSE